MAQKNFTLILTIITGIMLFSLHAAEITSAGARQSIYGSPDPFPETNEWKNVMYNMTENFNGSSDVAPVALWIIGTIDDNDNCDLEFPSDENYPMIDFRDESLGDKHEPYLTYFDKVGVKVYLQVESGDADVSTLIDIVLTQYGHHPCVIGFGVDAEWYFESQNPGWGKKVTDAKAKEWDELVKSHDPEYTIFLKHWDSGWMPPSYRSDIVFVNDGQNLSGLEFMTEYFTVWADDFAPNTVMYQVGYNSDYPWWGNYANAPKTIGEAIADDISNANQEVGIIWVDFTLSYSEVEYLFDEYTGNITNYNTAKVLNQYNLSIISNPLSPFLSINYALTEQNRDATLYIFTADGKMILSNRLQNKTGVISYDARRTGSGIYFITLVCSNYKTCKKSVLIR